MLERALEVGVGASGVWRGGQVVGREGERQVYLRVRLPITCGL